MQKLTDPRLQVLPLPIQRKELESKIQPINQRQSLGQIIRSTKALSGALTVSSSLFKSEELRHREGLRLRQHAEAAEPDRDGIIRIPREVQYQHAGHIASPLCRYELQRASTADWQALRVINERQQSSFLHCADVLLPDSSAEIP